EAYRRHGRAVAAVLLDVRMPGLDGPQTLAALRRLDPAVRCCLMSGEPGGYTAEELLRPGADGLPGQPVALGELAARVRPRGGARAGGGGVTGRGRLGGPRAPLARAGGSSRPGPPPAGARPAR